MPGKTNRIFKSFLAVMIAVLFVTGFFVFEKKDAAAEGDAIAVRVLANPQHLSPLAWYKSKKFTGNPTPLTVDGYQAIQDGRTVFVNVANVNSTCVSYAYNGNSCASDSDCDGTSGSCALGSQSKLYTNIYLISYNQEASPETITVFNKILSNWNFNTNLTEHGNCFGRSSDNASCSTDGDCPDGFTCNRGSCQQYCLVDKDCGGGYCGSLKARITRDIKRLGDISDLKSKIDSYNNRVGHYPLLGSGTYLTGKTISTWPSWNQEFAAEIGGAPPLDPINKFIGGCGDPKYDPLTCWDAKDKSFAGSFVDLTPTLPYDSRVLVYSTDAKGKNFNVCAEMESGLYVVDPTGDFTSDYCPGSNSRVPVPVISCGSLIGAQNQPFTGFVSVNDPQNNPSIFRVDNLPRGYTYKSTADPHKIEIDAANAADGGIFDITVVYKSDSVSGQLSQSCPINISSRASFIYPVADQKVTVGKQLNFPVYAFNSRKNYDGLTFDFAVQGNIIDLQCNQPLSITSDGRARCDVSVPTYAVAVPEKYNVIVTAKNTANCVSASTQPTTPPANNLSQPYFDFINNIFISNNYAYVVNWAGSSMLIVDITNPANPKAVGQIKNGDGGALLRNPGSVYVAGNYAYIASHGDNALEIVDISKKNNPTHAGSLSELTGALGVSVVNNYAYLADWEGGNLSVINVSDKTKPVFVNSVAIVQPYSVITNNGYAYVTRRNGGAYAFQIVDINNPANPTLIGGLTSNSLNQPLATALSGHYAFVNDWKDASIVAIDISSKTSPAFAGSFSSPGRPYSLEINGHYAYLPLYNSGALQIIDISDPSNMRQAGIINNGDGGAHLVHPVSVKVSGNYAYVASQGDNTLEIVDITNPNSPTHYKSLSNSGVALAPETDYQIASLAKDDLPYFDESGLEKNYSIAASDTLPPCENYTSQQFSLEITNKPPVIMAFNCDKSTRVGMTYMDNPNGNTGCAINATDPEGQQVAITVNGLPSGLYLHGNTIRGMPTQDSASAVPYNITISASDIYGATSPTVTFPLRVNNYCGDGIKQFPNFESKGGHANDGYEDCDCGAYLNKDGSIDYVACVRASGCTGVSNPLTAPQCAQNYKNNNGLILGNVPTTSMSSFLWQYGCTNKCATANGGFCGDGVAQDGLLLSKGAQETANDKSNPIMILKHSATNFGEQCDFSNLSTNCCNKCQWVTDGPTSPISLPNTLNIGPSQTQQLQLSDDILHSRGVKSGSFTAQYFDAQGKHPDIQAVVFVTDASNLGWFENPAAQRPPRFNMTNLKAAVQAGLTGFYNMSNDINGAGQGKRSNIYVGSLSFGSCTAQSTVPVCDVQNLVNFKNGNSDSLGNLNYQYEYAAVGKYDFYLDYNKNGTNESGANEAIIKATEMLHACDTDETLGCYGASQKYIIILSDGIDSSGSLDSVKTAKSYGIQIYAIDFPFGSSGPDIVCQWSSDYDKNGTKLRDCYANGASSYSFKNLNSSNPGAETEQIYTRIESSILDNMLKGGVTYNIGGDLNPLGGVGGTVDLNGVNNFVLPADSISCDISGINQCSTARRNPNNPKALNIYASFPDNAQGSAHPHVEFSDFIFNVLPLCQIQ
ncbi:MAG: hypothetical protein PHE24_02055 [Patescibacteria group bacterium]|nr:hypothetical protein [Patescibacteria group bacterium]